MLALGADHPDTTRASAVHVAPLINLHAVGVSLPHLLRTLLHKEQPPVLDRSVGCHVEGANVHVHRVVYVQESLVGREAEPVRALEVVYKELWLAAFRRDHIHTLKVELLRPLDAEIGLPTERGIGKVDGAARADYHVIRTV